VQIFNRLFGIKKAADAHCDDELDRMVTRVIGLNPRLRHAHEYDGRLRSAMAKSLVYLRDLVAAFPPPRAASP